MLHDFSYIPRQDRRRIEAWTEELGRHLYVPIQQLAWEGFLTYEHLSWQDALEQGFSSFPSGTMWGAKGQYGWFRTAFVLSSAYQKVVLCSPIGLGGEMLIYFDGQCVGSIDRHHSLVYLSFEATEGEHSLLVESYAGSGVLLEGGGPLPPGRSVYPAVPATQQKITSSSVGYVEEAAYQLYQDVYTLTSLLSVLEPTSLQAESIVSSLLEFTKVVDFEQEKESRVASYRKARELLSPLLRWNNGSCAPRFSVFGQSHIDLAWKWTVEETKRKCGRTYANQLTLLKQYPSYRFLLCEPALIEMLRTYHPEIFADLMEQYEKGKIIGEGAFWVECDTNLPNAESLIKQLVFGQRWFLRETGSYSSFAWLPDTFGFSASLPQLLSQAGVESFGTQKLLRADPESDLFPFTDFWWEGEDGTRILSNMSFKNNCEITAQQIYQRWHVDRKQREHIEGLLFPFGYGDGGGGPDRDLVEQLMRLQDLQGLPRLHIEGPKEYFSRIKSNVSNVHTGELYLAWHRGTYSSQQHLKQLNALCENALTEYSFWASLFDFADQIQLQKWWETVLFNQFHDILAGVSIKEVNRTAEIQLKQVFRESQNALEKVLQAKLEPKDGWYTVFNRNLHNVKTWICFPEGNAVYQEGKVVPSYLDSEGLWGLVNLAPTSATTFEIGKERNVGRTVKASLVKETKDGFFFASEKMSFLIDWNATLRDVRYKGNLICPMANAFVLYQDINPDYDAWEIGRVSITMKKAEPVVQSMQVVVDTDETAQLSILLQIGSSKINQLVSFDAGTSEVHFALQVDWKEKHTLLKSTFTHAFVTEDYFCDTQLGYKQLPSHSNTVSARDRYEICGQRYAAFKDERHTLLLMNSYPFGLSVDHHQFGLTLLRSALIPDETGEEGLHSLSYGFAVEETTFSGNEAKRRALLLSHRFPMLPGLYQCEPFFLLKRGAAVLTAVEENQDGMLVVRLSNPSRCSEQLLLTTKLGSLEAYQCTILEDQRRPLKREGEGYRIELPPFSLRTLLFSLEKAKNAQF